MSVKSKIQYASSQEFTAWFFGIIIIFAVVLYIWQLVFGVPVLKNVDEAVNSEKNILVNNPNPEEEIGLPLVIGGEARVFENTVNIILKDETDTVLVEDIAQANAEEIGEFGGFEKKFSYAEPQTNRGSLEVFSISPKDGTRINEIVIPVKFKKVQSKLISVFFNNLPTKESNNCGDIIGVERRIINDVNIFDNSLKELIRGPTVLDMKNNLTTSINSETKLLGLVVQDGVARADFSNTLAPSAEDLCNIKNARAQIEQTLKQFTEIKRVIISIDGRTNVLGK